MATPFEIEDQGEHEFVVRLRTPAETVETWFRLTPAVLDGLGLAEAEETDVIRRSVDFLLRHQNAEDFPRILELEDLLAVYEDCPAALRAD